MVWVGIGLLLCNLSNFVIRNKIFYQYVFPVNFGFWRNQLSIHQHKSNISDCLCSTTLSIPNIMSIQVLIVQLHTTLSKISTMHRFEINSSYLGGMSFCNHLEIRSGSCRQQIGFSWANTSAIFDSVMARRYTCTNKHLLRMLYEEWCSGG